MTAIILNLVMAIVNLLLAYINYDFENYKTSNFNSFTGGFCLAVMIKLILEL
ncbi:hypothetical protein Nekkels1_78 [Cellulophaga phage Nekkels_1]|uniref:Uncharacterized protein n=1 Tax=Cellulophaga phage Nekkels_1 TaxID=2745692 RepID=A0A8E4XXR5_9CAUD|nr:hypothetical protein M1M31_gp78 [Cellulophaga phage Nekkels_1]QQO97083.1 hypothetical protein Nekkels1_78 [Cellulophaga phage Nekkels_1]